LQKLEQSSDGMSEIVVVHEKAVPKLHGILKQRTVSESSDDSWHACLSGCDRQLSTTTGSEGDDNEGSPDGSATLVVRGSGQVLRKSVSFNDRIDRTLFQVNQSVSSMHAALKNRRRRARKRDQKQEQKEQRRRRRSSGSFSMEESGDEQFADKQAACVPAKECGTNATAAAETGPETNDWSSHSNDGAGDAEISHRMAVAPRDVPGSGFSFEHAGVSQNDELSPGVTADENLHFLDEFRTKNYRDDCGRYMVNDGAVNATNVCDTTLKDAYGNENCMSDLPSVRDGSSAGHISNIGSDTSFELNGSIQTDCSQSDSVVVTTQASEKVSYMSTLFDLDVD